MKFDIAGNANKAATTAATAGGEAGAHASQGSGGEISRHLRNEVMESEDGVRGVRHPIVETLADGIAGDVSRENRVVCCVYERTARAVPTRSCTSA